MEEQLFYYSSTALNAKFRRLAVWSYSLRVTTSDGKEEQGVQWVVKSTSLRRTSARRGRGPMALDTNTVHCILIVNLPGTPWEAGGGAYNGHRRAESLFTVTMVNHSAVRAISVITVVAAFERGWSRCARVVNVTKAGLLCPYMIGEWRVWTSHMLKLDPPEI